MIVEYEHIVRPTKKQKQQKQPDGKLENKIVRVPELRQVPIRLNVDLMIRNFANQFQQNNNIEKQQILDTIVEGKNEEKSSILLPTVRERYAGWTRKNSPYSSSVPIELQVHVPSWTENNYQSLASWSEEEKRIYRKKVVTYCRKEFK